MRIQWNEIKRVKVDLNKNVERPVIHEIKIIWEILGIYAHTHTKSCWLRNSLGAICSQRWPKSQSLQRWLATKGGMDSNFTYKWVLWTQGSHGWIVSWCWGRNSFPKRKERSAMGTQGHTRTGDNEIRVNEGWKKPSSWLGWWDCHRRRG